MSARVVDQALYIMTLHLGGHQLTKELAINNLCEKLLEDYPEDAAKARELGLKLAKEQLPR